jgi:uncharacterized membrane protein YagU involved in acid resistance
MHYTFGAVSGAAYGMLSHFVPITRAGRGALFGAALWAIADETMVPALGLSKGPAEYPLSTHVYGLASHLVYGMTTDATARSIGTLVNVGRIVGGLKAIASLLSELK